MFGNILTLGTLDINKQILLSIYLFDALYLPSISEKNALYFALYFSTFALYGKLDSMLYPLLTFFSTRVLESYLGGLKAACIGPALSKFRPSVEDRAT